MRVMKIGVLQEVAEREKRVALVPDSVAKLVASGHGVLIEAGAGNAAGFRDSDYDDAGANVVSRQDVLAGSTVLLQVRASGTHSLPDGVREALHDGTVLIANVDPLWMAPNVSDLAETGASVLALELVPRITRAQSMDVLSSQATVAGYEAVLLAASRAPRMFPMLMTAAGTVPPTRVVVLGAGVAGLQAIATAKRLGAVVEAYDVRPAAAEQIKSVGGKAIELEFETGDSEDAGGYAREQSEDQNAQQQRLLTPFIAEADVVITTAAIPGARSPVLLTEAMVDEMKPGSVIVDLAAERGGNCSLTVADVEIEHDGVIVLGPTDLPSHSARNASQMLSNNISTVLEHLVADGDLVIDPSDEITSAMLVTAAGDVVNPRVLEKLGRSASAAAGTSGEEE
jgi:NAD(P) transhydrogenase subunit alpha